MLRRLHGKHVKECGEVGRWGGAVVLGGVGGGGERRGGLAFISCLALGTKHYVIQVVVVVDCTRIQHTTTELQSGAGC